MWLYLIIVMLVNCNQKIVAQPQPPQGAVAAAGGAYPPPPPPPGRGFQLKCSDQFASEDVCDPELLRQFDDNAPPGYHVVAVDPCIYPGKNAHRYVVKYRSDHFRRCEDIKRVSQDMNTFKPQNSNVGVIAVVPGGYTVEYKQFCACYRRAFRRKRWISKGFYYAISPTKDSAGNMVRCDDRDFTCGVQSF